MSAPRGFSSGSAVTGESEAQSAWSGCPQVSGPQSHWASRHHPGGCVPSGNTGPASLEALTTGPLTGQAMGPDLGRVPAQAPARCPLCEMPPAHGISGRCTAPSHRPALTRALQRAASDPHFRVREGSSELPVSEATQPVHAMEGLTPLLSVKITDLLLAETRWEGAQHRNSDGSCSLRAHSAHSDPRRPASGDEAPSTPCSPVCPTMEALSLWGILEDTFKAMRIW